MKDDGVSRGMASVEKRGKVGKNNSGAEKGLRAGAEGRGSISMGSLLPVLPATLRPVVGLMDGNSSTWVSSIPVCDTPWPL